MSLMEAIEPGNVQGRDRRLDVVSYSSWGDLSGTQKRSTEGRFSLPNTADPTSSKAVLDSITTVQKAFDGLIPDFLKMAEPLVWKYATPAETDTFSQKATVIEGKLVRQKNTRQGIGGIDAKLPCIIDEKAIPETTRKYQVLEMQLRLFEKALKRVKTLSKNDTYRGAYKLYKEKLESMKVLVNTSSRKMAIANKIASFKGMYKEITDAIAAQDEQAKLLEDKRERRAIKQLHFEVIASALQAAAQLQASAAEDDDVIAQTIGEINTLGASLKQALEGPLGKGTLEGAEPQVISDEMLRKFHESKLTTQEWAFRFSKQMHTTVWSYYQMGYYRDTGRLGQEMQEQVAYKLVGLQRKVHARLFALSQGILDFAENGKAIEEGKNSVKQLLDYYHSVMVTLQKTLDGLRTRLNTLPLDDLAPYVRNYGQGLDEVIATIRYKLKLCYAFIRKDEAREIDNLSILQAENWLFTHFDQAKVSSIPQVASFEKAERIYQSSVLMFNARKLGEKKLADKFLRLTADTIGKIHSKKDVHALELTKDEQKVPDRLFALDDLRVLRHESEAATKLPVVVEAFLMKKMTKILFHQGDDHDAELELVLHLLNTNPKYKPLFEESIRANHVFHDAINRYNAVYEKARLSSAQLKEACALMGLILEANGEQRNPLGFAKVWQGFFEHQQAYKTLEVVPMLDKLLGYLTSRLELVAKEKKYVPFFDNKTRDAGLDSYDVSGNPEGVKAVLLERARESQNDYLDLSVDALNKKIFENLLFKALAGCLFAKEPGEWRVAHNVVFQIFSKEEFADLRKELPEDIVAMLQENTMNKLIEGSPETSVAEGKLFMDGPLARFFQKKEHTIDETKVQHALFSLIRKEKALHDTVCTSAFENAVGKVKADKWYADYEMRLRASEMEKLFADLVISEDARKGREQPVLAPLLRGRMGAEGFDRWVQYHRNRPNLP